MKRQLSEWTKRELDARKIVGRLTRYQPTLLSGELKDSTTVKLLLEPFRFEKFGSTFHLAVQV